MFCLKYKKGKLIRDSSGNIRTFETVGKLRRFCQKHFFGEEIQFGQSDTITRKTKSQDIDWNDFNYARN